MSTAHTHGLFAKARRIASLSRQRAAEGHLPFLRQAIEMLTLRALRGVGPGYYHTAGFWRAGLAWKDKIGQMSAGEYRRFLAKWNPPDYRKLSQHKVAEKAILSLFGVPTPRFLGLLAARNGSDNQGRPLRGADDLVALIEREGAQRLVFKELEGYGGKGVRIVDVHRGEAVELAPLGSTTRQPVGAYVASTLQAAGERAWLVEEYFTQHESMHRLNPTSVNTVRIWVLEVSESDSRIVTAYTRIGRGGMVVDNATSGGIVAPIDLDTGVLRAAQDAYAERRLYASHPDHGARIEGVRIPHWDQVQHIARRALGVFPRLRFAGLDVAIGESGPVVLELNVCPDREAAAFTGCATRSLLGL